MAEYEVTGVRYQMGKDLTMEERTRKAEDFIKSLKVNTPMILMAEPDNPKDYEAIAVYMDYTRRVGYIAHESCAEVKLQLDSYAQCNAVVSGNDGHVTFYVEIPNAPEVNASPVEAPRELPDYPLPQGIGLTFSDKEHALLVVAPRLVNLEVSADTVGTLIDMTEHYMPLSRLSLCHEDDIWRERVMKQLRKTCRLKLPPSEKERLEQLRDELQETMGDFHRTHEHWQQQLFDQQLDMLREQAEGEEGLFAKYEKYRESQPDIIKSLVKWFDEMPHVDLRNYKEHGCLAQRLNYMRVSRKELYEVYAAILLLNKYGGEKPEKEDTIKLPKGLDTEKAKKYFAKAIEEGYMEATEDGKYHWIGTGKKPITSELAYFLGKVYNYKHDTIKGNIGEPFPEEDLNALFSVKRLYSSLTQVYSAKIRQRWRSRIDDLFEED